MKKVTAIIWIVLAVVLLCRFGCETEKNAKGTNAKINYTGPASVSFYPVCPECDHVSPYSSVNISDGEHGEYIYTCENCWEVYEITIDRR